MAAKSRTLHDLFLHQLRDVHHADRQAGKLFGKLAKATDTEALKSAFESFAHQTHDQVDRIDAVFDRLDKKFHSVPCEAMAGLVEEAKELLHDFADCEALDAGLVAAGQAVVHYGLARYGSLRAWSMQLGLDGITPMIEAGLGDKRAMSQTLDGLAGSTPQATADASVETILTPRMAALTGLA